MTRRSSGMTLVEAALAVCVVAAALAAFVPAFARNVRGSKLAEASAELEALSRRTVAYYEARHHDAGGRMLTECVPSSAGPAPAGPSRDPVIVDFAANSTSGSGTWRALDFQPKQPVRYRYSFVAGRAGCGLGSSRGVLATLRAEGDLDGDGTLSTFERNLGVDGRGQLGPVGVLYVLNRVE